MASRGPGPVSIIKETTQGKAESAAAKDSAAPEADPFRKSSKMGRSPTKVPKSPPIFSPAVEQKQADTAHAGGPTEAGVFHFSAISEQGLAPLIANGDIDGVIGAIGAKLSQLNSMMLGKTRVMVTIPMKELVQQVIALQKSAVRIRETAPKIPSEQNPTPKRSRESPRAGKLSAPKRQKVPKPCGTSNKVVKAITYASAAKQISGPLPPCHADKGTKEGAEKWSTVTKKPKKQLPKKQQQHRKLPPRTDALVVKCGEGMQYADVLKLVKNNPTLQQHKDCVKGIRMTGRGELLIKMMKTADPATSKLQKAMQETLSDKAEVKELKELVQVEIRDTAEFSSKDDIIQAVFTNYEGDIPPAAIPSLRKTYGGTLIARMSIPPVLAEKILAEGKIRIDWAHCRVRKSVEPKRCYKCLAFGHMALHCRSKVDLSKAAAQDLLAQTVRALKIDLAILSEPYASKHDGIWFQNSQGGAAIWSCSPRPLQIQCRHSGRGFVRAKVGSLTIYSCYIAPSVDSQTFGSIVDDILEDARGRHPIIIAGDFNAWATEWGSRLTNHRGHIFLDAVARSGLTLANTGTANTYEKAGMGSVIDITFMSSTLTRTSAWQVSEIYTGSDHRAITMEIRDGRFKRKNTNASTGFRDSTLDPQALILMAEDLVYDERKNANENAVGIKKATWSACAASMQRRRAGGNGCPPVYWWTDAIAEARRKCHQARRQYMRSRGRPDFASLQRLYKSVRSALKKEISASKKQCFAKLCDDADTRPWGTAYKLVMGKLAAFSQPTPTCPEQLSNIVAQLFPPSVALQPQQEPSPL
ncbi:uncharacterized protein LOC122320310 [Drosophila ficusphila]|uniref:uncharacterized protein LOC122320310 n=1 Tax=Drosophila ficusphila TaxID=30025 RepID=UPI001C897705|nr:uncharacterized protein LOC122320310 [Drosophila ficusphila]